MPLYGGIMLGTGLILPSIFVIVCRAIGITASVLILHQRKHINDTVDTLIRHWITAVYERW